MKKIKSSVTVAVIFFVMLSTALSFAAPAIFTDISNHWAKEHIEDVYERRLITGYSDATFKPGENITKLETIVIISRLMGYSDSNEQHYVNQYKQQLKDNNIPDWGQGAVAYALFNDILSAKELQSLVSVTGSTYAKRYEVAIYIGRVLQYGAGEEIGGIYIIPYKDEMSIPDEAKPYIDLLLNKKILDKTSNDGRFLPDNKITRAEVAKLVSMSAKILDKLSDDDVIVEPDIPPVTTDKVLEGYFYYYLSGQDSRVFISDEKEKIHDFAFTRKSSVRISGKLAGIDDLKPGDIVTVTYIDDEIIEIKADPKERYFEGVVRAKDSDEDEDILEVLLDSKTIKTFVIPSKAALKRDRRTVDFKDIKVGDDVEITTEYDKVVYVDAFSIKRTVEGYIRKMVIAQRPEPTKITVEKYDGTVETFTLVPDTVIRVEEKRAGIYDLRLNYEVELEIENDEIVWIETYRKFQGSNYTGKVMYKDTRRGVLELQIRAGEEIEIYIDDDTIYIDEDGNSIRLGDIYVGDEIGVFAEDNGYYIMAKKVFIIIQR